MIDAIKFLTSNVEDYEAKERTAHYLRAFNDEQDDELTLLIRDDQWESAENRDYLKYVASAVSISREDAVTFAKWILERFDV